jgi:hypothetical protein
VGHGARPKPASPLPISGWNRQEPSFPEGPVRGSAPKRLSSPRHGPLRSRGSIAFRSGSPGSEAPSATLVSAGPKPVPIRCGFSRRCRSNNKIRLSRPFRAEALCDLPTARPPKPERCRSARLWPKPPVRLRNRSGPEPFPISRPHIRRSLCASGRLAFGRSLRFAFETVPGRSLSRFPDRTSAEAFARPVGSPSAEASGSPCEIDPGRSLSRSPDRASAEAFARPVGSPSAEASGSPCEIVPGRSPSRSPDRASAEAFARPFGSPSAEASGLPCEIVPGRSPSRSPDRASAEAFARPVGSPSAEA